MDFYDEHHNKAEDRQLFPREMIAIREIEQYLNNVNKEVNILDVGCGQGIFLNNISQNRNQSFSLYGCDFSEHQLNFAKQTVTNADFKQANFDNGIPYEDESMDIIYSGEVIEHLYDPDFFISEIYRVLKKDGLLILTTPNLCSWISRIFFTVGIYPLFYESSTKNSNYGFKYLKKLKQQDIPVGHIRLMNLDALQALLTDQKLTIKRVNGFPFHGFSGAIAALDRLMAKRPSLASGFVVSGLKKG